ncbi:MAG: hypothetical protein EXS00_08215 [Phycisphaerales bacterium]|nr:hypothetical protein [Phycisphaerales bacterium]
MKLTRTSLGLLALVSVSAAAPTREALATPAPQAASTLAPEANATTGEWLRKFPSDRDADIDHTRLVMRFEDLGDRSFTAQESIRFHATNPPLAKMELDAEALQISSIRLGGVLEAQKNAAGLQVTQLKWSLQGSKLKLEFSPPLGAGSHELLIDYRCSNPAEGMLFAPASPGVAPQMHTQGEADSNHHWFVCHDFPNDRMTTEVIANVPAGVSLSSNGELIEHSVAGGREVWHWRQDKPHVAYLVSIVAGEFSRVPLPNAISGVPMEVWVTPGQEALAARTYERTDQMIAVLAKAFGSPYPWARYDQLLVRDFGAGGMENTSATTMMSSALIQDAAIGDRDFDSLIAHELCHQWTGDLITCETWEHLWLNEGWATYGSGLWFEARDGKEAYLDEVLGYFAVAENDSVDGPAPMTSNLYSDPGECFGRAANPYGKGASILHMLRVQLGEETFFAGVRAYFARHALETVETDDFRHCLEEVSGKSLEKFFDQWCLRPGTPRLAMKAAVEQDGRLLRLSLDQSQRIDAATPAFAFTLPIEITTKTGVVRTSMDVSERTSMVEVPVDSPILSVSVDPDCAVLKTITTDFPTAWLTAAAGSGSTRAAKRVALRELGSRDDEASRAALAATVRDTTLWHSLRTEAVAALASHASVESKAMMATLASEPQETNRVRRALVSAVGRSKCEGAPKLVVAATADPSQGVREAACEALAALRPDLAVQPEVTAALIEVMRSPTSGDRARGAAMQTCSALLAVGALDAVIELTQLGVFDRTRASAISTLKELAKADPAVRQQVVPVLIQLLDDGEWRVYASAGDSLADLGALEALERLASIQSSSPSAKRIQMAAGWVNRINEEQKKVAAAAAQAEQTAKDAAAQAESATAEQAAKDAAAQAAPAPVGGG